MTSGNCSLFIWRTESRKRRKKLSSFTQRKVESWKKNELNKCLEKQKEIFMEFREELSKLSSGISQIRNNIEECKTGKEPKLSELDQNEDDEV